MILCHNLLTFNDLYEYQYGFALQTITACIEDLRCLDLIENLKLFRLFDPDLLLLLTTNRPFSNVSSNLPKCYSFFLNPLFAEKTLSSVNRDLSTTEVDYLLYILSDGDSNPVDVINGALLSKDSLLYYIARSDDLATYGNFENVMASYHYSVPTVKLAYPEPFIASPTFIHSDLWFVHILVFQYWLWFFFIFLIVFFFITFLCTVRWCNNRVRPCRETRGVSRSKCGDLITATVPITWAISIIIHESTDAIDYYDGFGTTELVVGVRAYQWGWEYYYPKDIDLGYNVKTSCAPFVGNSLKYKKSSYANLRANNLWKYYQNKSTDQIVTPAHILVFPIDTYKLLNFVNFSDVGSSSAQEMNAYKKIRMFSKTYSTNLMFVPNNFSTKFKILSNLYINDSLFTDSYLYGLKRQHGFLSTKSSFNNQSSFLSLRSANKLVNYSFKNNASFPVKIDQSNRLSLLKKNSHALITPNLSRISSVFADSYSDNHLQFLTNTTSLSNFVTSINSSSAKRKISFPMWKLFNTRLKQNNFYNYYILNKLNYPSDLVLLNFNREAENFILNNNLSYKITFTLSKNQPEPLANRFVRNFTPNPISAANLNYSSSINAGNEYLKNSNSSPALNGNFYVNTSNFGWLSVITSKKYLSSKVASGSPSSPIISNNPSTHMTDFDNLTNTSAKGTPEMPFKKPEATSNFLTNTSWNFFWSNSNIAWKSYNNSIYCSISKSFYFPMFSFYFAYDFRNWQFLQVLEDCFWESIYSNGTQDKNLNLREFFYANEYSNKPNNFYSRLNRRKTIASGFLPDVSACDYLHRTIGTDLFYKRCPLETTLSEHTGGPILTWVHLFVPRYSYLLVLPHYGPDFGKSSCKSFTLPVKRKALTTSLFNADSYVGDFYLNSFHLDDFIFPPDLNNTKFFCSLPLFTRFSRLENNYGASKHLSYSLSNTCKVFFNITMSGFQPYSYFHVINSFCAIYSDFSWFVSENTFIKKALTSNNFPAVSKVDESHNSFLDYWFMNLVNCPDDNNWSRFSNFLSLRQSAKNSLVTYNAIQKVFKARFDENRSNAKLGDFANFFVRQPFISSQRPQYEKLFGKTKRNFFEVNLYKNNFHKHSNNFWDTGITLNTYFYDFPFLLALKGDASRYLWLDWFAKWGLYGIQPSSASRYAIYGMPYFFKNFEFDSPTNAILRESEAYLSRLSRARRNYLPNWAYTPYLYARNSSWYQNNLLYEILQKATNKLLVTENTLKLACWYWKNLYFANNTNYLFEPTHSVAACYARLNWRPQNTIQAYYYSVGYLAEILTKREYLYREFFAYNNKIISLPLYLTCTSSNPLINEVKSSFTFVDPINNNNEYSREVYFNSLKFFNHNVLKIFLVDYYQLLGLNFVNDYLVCHFFMNSPVNTSSHNLELYKNQYRPMKKGITNMVRLHASGAVAMPIEIRLQVLASSKDVIHSWAIPSAGVKIDCIPGYSSHKLMIFLVSGIFWGQCMEVCGRYHHWMPIVIYFMKRDLFFLWCIHFVTLSGSNVMWNINDRQYIDSTKAVSFDKYSWLTEISN